MRVELPSGNVIELVRALPPSNQGVVVLSDLGGLRTLFEEIAARLVGELRSDVCVLDIFGRTPDLPLDERRNAVSSLDDDQALTDIQEAVTSLGYLRPHLIGFCLGGMMAFKATQADAFSRVVSFYGMTRLPMAAKSSPGKVDQREPLDAVRVTKKQSVLGLFGGSDPYTPAADISRLEALGVEVHIYPNAGHAFAHDPNASSYRADDAQDAWARALGFLAQRSDG